MNIRLNGIEIAMVVWEALSILVFAFTSNNANACSNQYVGFLAAEKCTPWVAFHELAIAGMWIAAVIFVVAVVIQVLSHGNDKTPE